MEENKTDELVQSIQTLNKENDNLREKLAEFEAKEAERAKEEEIKKRVAEELKKIKEQEEEEAEPEKEEEPESKGVVDEPAEEAEAEVKEAFAFVSIGPGGINYKRKGPHLTMTKEYFAEFDNEVRNLDWMKGVRWIPNNTVEVEAND